MQLQLISVTCNHVLYHVTQPCFLNPSFPFSRLIIALVLIMCLLLTCSTHGPWAGADDFRVGCTPCSTRGFLLIRMVLNLYFRVGCTRCPTKVFCWFLWFCISCLLFQLVSSFKKCPFALKTACFDGTLYGAEFYVLKFPSKTYFRIWCKSIINRVSFSNRVSFYKDLCSVPSGDSRIR